MLICFNLLKGGGQTLVLIGMYAMIKIGEKNRLPLKKKKLLCLVTLVKPRCLGVVRLS